MSKRVRVLLVIFAGVMMWGAGLAQTPVENIDPKVHANLAQAQHLVVQADQYIALAQKVNADDMQGHAARARQLLIQVNQELKVAADLASAASAAREKGKK